MRTGILKIGIVGCGAIGSSLAQFITCTLKGRAVLVSVLDLDRAKAERLLKQLRLSRQRCAADLGALINASDLVVECAHARSSGSICRQALERGRSVMVMSVGGIVGSFEALKKIARQKRARLYIPSGAIAGIDAVKALRVAGPLKRVTLITRKHPRSFDGVAYVERKGIRLDRITGERTIFFGPARQALKHFPQNINVAAVLSLSGMGLGRTMVKIIASPSIKTNIHEVRAESKAGIVTARVENTLHPDNPKTSYLAVLSASSMLHNIVEPATIGT